MVEDELLEEAPVTWFLSYRGAPLLLLPIRLMELIMDFPQEIPAHGSCHATGPEEGIDGELTLEGTALGAAGGDEVERNVGRTTDVLVGEAPALAFVASTHHPLAEEVGPPDDKDQQDDGDDRHDGVGAAVGAVRWRDVV